MSQSLRLCILMLALWILGAIFGAALWGLWGAAVAASLSILFLAALVIFSDRWLLRMLGARPVGPYEYRNIYGKAHVIARRMGLRSPSVWVLPSIPEWLLPNHEGKIFNAFALGRNDQHGAVVVTEGLIEALNEDELSGVLAFELSVIAEGVTLANGVAAVLAYFLLSFVLRPRKRQPRWRQGICIFSYFIFGSLAAAIVRFLASRKKVFGADERSARTLRTSKGLVSALHRIETLNQDYAFLIHESFHHLFMIPPVGRERSVLRLFDNHPTTDKRIERLSQLDVNFALR